VPTKPKILVLTLDLFYNNLTYIIVITLSPDTVKFVFAIDVSFKYAGAPTANCSNLKLLRYYS